MKHQLHTHHTLRCAPNGAAPGNRSLQDLWPPHPLQQTHLLEVGAGVGQPLQRVRQVVVSAEVEAVGHQHVVDHGQEGLILLRLGEERTQV